MSRAQDYVRLLTRGNELLKYPLTDDEREYIHSLLERLGAGNQPLLPDWFRTQELVDKYARGVIPRIIRRIWSKPKP